MGAGGHPPKRKNMYKAAPTSFWHRAKVFFRPSEALFVHCQNTTGHIPPQRDGSWLSLWRKVAAGASGAAAATECSFQGCCRIAAVGAHVSYSGSITRFASWYIVPACSSCNAQHGMAAPLKPGTMLLRVRRRRLFRNEVLFGIYGSGRGTVVRSSKDEADHVRKWPHPNRLGNGWKVP